MQNSWYLKEDGQHHFFCKCGRHDVLNYNENNDDFEMIDFKKEEIYLSQNPNFYYPDNYCEVCSNEKYLDLKALFYEDKTRYWSNVQWEYHEEINTHGWHVKAFIKIPKFDRKTKIITTEYIELSSHKINRDGQGDYSETNNIFLKKSMIRDEKYCRFDRILKDNINNKTLKLILENPSESIKWLNGEVKNLEKLLFFLKNPKIRSQDMFTWKNKEYFLEAMNEHQYVDKFLVYILNYRKEKSLRKSQFNSYVQMMESGEYNPMTDYIFCQTINDVNHLNKALKIDIEVKKKLFNGCSIENIKYFIDFLKNFYDEKHIVELWLSIRIDDLFHYLVRDSVNLFNNKGMREELKKNFQKTSLNIRAIHDEVTRHSRRIEKLKMKNEKLSYSDLMINSEGTKEGITYTLPLDCQELYEWGSILHNCIFAYKDIIINGRSTIFGLFVNKQLTYALEIRNDKIIQVSAPYNQTLSKLEREKVARWHKEVYMKNLMRLF